MALNGTGTPVRPRFGLRAALCLLALASLLGCRGQAADIARATSPSTGTASPTSTEETPALVKPVDYRAADVEASTKSVAAQLSDVRLTARFAIGGFVVCQGGEVDTFTDVRLGYTVQSRFDYYVGKVGSQSDAEDIVASLRSDGWEPRNDDWATGGVHRVPSNDSWTLYLSRAGLTLRLDLGADAPVVLASLSGPCEPTPAEEANQLRIHAGQDIKLPGSVPLSDSPVRVGEGKFLPARQP